MTGVIDVRGVSKRYGEKVAVDDLTFSVAPGIVTGFLGPNGAGKSTTMRLILGLDAPTSGTVRVNGCAYRDFAAPLHEIGAMLEAHAIHTGRSAYNHLLALAQTHGIPRSRVEEVIELVGLREVARKRVGGFSLGMGQRLGVAAALLGDPAHGDPRRARQRPRSGGHPLDPQPAQEPRRRRAHGLPLLASDERDGPDRRASDRDRARAADRRYLRRGVRAPRLLRYQRACPLAPGDRAARRRWPGASAEVQSIEEGLLEVSGLTGEQIGEIALEARIVISELTPQQASLEEAFMSLTGESVEYRASAGEENEASENVRAAA